MEHISNVEKANEIAQSISFFWTNEDDAEKSIIDTVSLRKAIFNAVMQAMELKDKQYNEEKRDLLGLVKMLKIDEHNQIIIEDLVAILNS